VKGIQFLHCNPFNSLFLSLSLSPWIFFFPFLPLFLSHTTMAPSPSLLLIFFMITVAFFSLLPHAAKLPFHPLDVVPLLPRQASWPILNSLYSPVDILPSFVGAASSPKDTLEWKGACFYKSRAWMEFHNKSGTEFGGGTLHIQVWNLSLLACFLWFWRWYPSYPCSCPG
jgi:hypothetical protein